LIRIETNSRQSGVMDPLFQTLASLDFPLREFAIFGSGPLIVRDIIPVTNDLDILCRGAAWARAKLLGSIEYLEKYDVTIASIADGQLTFGTEWRIGTFDVDSLIDNAELIGGLPFVQIKHVIDYKLGRASPKDLQHIDAFLRSDYG